MVCMLPVNPSLMVNVFSFMAETNFSKNILLFLQQTFNEL